MTTTTTVATTPTTPGVLLQRLTGRYAGPVDIDAQLRLATALAGATDAVPDMYHGNPGNVLATMLHAQTLDIGVMTALGNLHFSNGKSGMSAALMHGLILRAGHTIEILEVTDKLARLRLTRGDSRPGGEVSWTMVEAALAKLIDKGAWRLYPADNLFARALSRLARRYAGDVVLGFGYVPEELESMTDDSTDGGDRQVSPDVQTLLTDLDPDTATTEALRALWSQARKAGLADAYAGEVDGVAYTVAGLLGFYDTAARERATTRAAQDAAEAPEPTVEEATAALADAGAVAAAAAAPAGTGLMPCGCVSMQVMKTGKHRAGCSHAAAA
jgi:hypothetical protein